MSNITHTPGPLHLDGGRISDNEGSPVAVTVWGGSGKGPRMLPNAERIVATWNAHAELVAALRGLATGTPSRMDFERARAVLAKVRP